MRTLVSLITLGLCCVLFSASVHAQRMASYYTQYDLLAAPPSVVGEGLSGFANPALPALQPNALQLQWSTDGRDHGGVSDIGAFSSVGGLSSGALGIRPLGTSRLTVFGDMAVFQGDALRDAPWSIGGAVQVIEGLEAVGHYFESEAFSLGLRVNLDRAGVQSQDRYNSSQEYASSTYGVRIGEAQPSAISEAVQREGKHVALELGGTLGYQQTQVQAWTQDGVGRFYEALRTIERAGDSERVQTLALNLSGLRIQPALAWELRQALQNAQDESTTVFVYIDNAGMNTYHIASVADHLRTELVHEALDMAAEQRNPEETTYHSDQGCQYTALAFGNLCRDAGVRPSMGSVGDCFDNAMCESFFATLECELIDQESFADRS